GKVKSGDVVIHNHPDAELQPSEADMKAAALFADLGVGFYIIDNDASDIYVVIERFPKLVTERLSCNEIKEHFSINGSFAKSLEGYEIREQQQDMLEGVVQAFNEEAILIAEAGTGIGKSLSYLVPSVLWSLMSDERVVISTNTIPLQEQLINKDIPLVRKCLNKVFKSVLVKGRNNYLCLRKLYTLEHEPELFFDGAIKKQASSLLEWVLVTKDGSLSDLSFVPSEQLWDSVQSDQDSCGRLKCMHYEDCFFYRARRQASSAQILVVNHHLLLADLAVRKITGQYSLPAVLPPFSRIVFDEAHELEEAATRHFGFNLTQKGIRKLFNRLWKNKTHQKGLLPFIALKLREIPKKKQKDELESLEETIYTEIQKLHYEVYGKINESFLEIPLVLIKLKEETEFEMNLKIRITSAILENELWQNSFIPILHSLGCSIEGYADRLMKLSKDLKRLYPEPGETLQSAMIELEAIIRKINSYAVNVFFFLSEEEGYCRWAESNKGSRGGYSIALCCYPLNIADMMKLCIYDRFRTVIATSATMTVSKKFDFFMERTGLDLVNPERRMLLQLDSPFDYPKQALVCVPAGIPNPDEAGFNDSLKKLIKHLVTIRCGGIFVLFTAYRLLREVFSAVSDECTVRGYFPLIQGVQSRKKLLETFLKRKPSILFATDSFWQGVDVRGSSLECVIITRLPFRVPTDPIIQARSEALQLAGKDSFYHYLLPMAVMRFRQGFGRLIRSKEDRGVILIMDQRVFTRKYGKVFLKSLPELELFSGKTDEVLHRIKLFYDSDKPLR
ncbi:MAG: helicase C-terminal domain-containing protein, partial [Candidatus Theseobacter exili]|nr:helicase C-terminal domain-containing protein [Candidatus Theseobacter exili]